MLARIDVRGSSGDLRAILERSRAAGPDIGAAVAAILADVQANGANAVRELTARFDGVDVAEPRVAPGEISAAQARISPELRAAFELARDQIVAWHEAQKDHEADHERLGVGVTELVVPVDRAGCYVPGGRAPRRPS